MTARAVTGTLVDGSLVVASTHRTTAASVRAAVASGASAYALADRAGASREPRPGDVLGLYREASATYAVRPPR